MIQQFFSKSKILLKNDQKTRIIQKYSLKINQFTLVLVSRKNQFVNPFMYVVLKNIPFKLVTLEELNYHVPKYFYPKSTSNTYL